MKEITFPSEMLQKILTFCPNFNLSDRQTGLLALLDFLAKNLTPTFAFPPQFLPFPERRKGN